MIENVLEQNVLSAADKDREQHYKIHYVDLASERIGGETLSCSDDFFAPMENLLKPGRGVFIEHKYTDRGKWMEGWESRRSYGRDNGREFDWCIIKLGVAGVIRAFDVDTNYFRGNAPQSVMVEACYCQGEPDANSQWRKVLAQSQVWAHSQNLFDVESEQVFTHVRLSMFPDGGIARFRVYGDAVVDRKQFVEGELIDLAYIKNGAKALLVSDMFFSDKNNLIMPGRGKDMGDGWETKRRRDPGPDWSIIKLATSGTIHKVIVDTCHFKGNFPDSFMLEAINWQEPITDLASVPQGWQPIIARTKLQANREHLFIDDILLQEQKFTHVRLSIFPDGGVSRMRVFGRPDWSENADDN